MMIGALLLACATSQPIELPTPGAMERTGEVITTVNGQDVTQGMLDNYFLAMPVPVRKQIEARGQVERVKEKVILQEMLYQEALSRGLHNRPKVQVLLAIAAREALSQALLEQVIEEGTTDETVKAWYEEHLVQFRKAQVNASHILVKTEELAKELHGKLVAGADFAELAKAHSTDSGSGANGGELGWFELGQMVKPFSDAAFGAEKGQLLEPVESQFGWHIILVTDKREAAPLEDVREEIEARMGQEIATNFLDEIKEKSKSPEAEAPVQEGATLEVPGAAG
jgi:peptidyl-prolyl cis-trans isomerase C